MEIEKKDVALRKRQLIQDSARKMFIWVAVASVLIGFALVTSWFLFQQITYKEKVLMAKADTIKTLKANNDVAPKLVGNVRVLETNEALGSVKVNQNENAVQVVLDALPSENNPFALGASMQRVLVGGAVGVKLESFSMDSASNNIKTKSPNPDAKPIPFTLVVSSVDPNAIKEMLKRLEASIRTIDIDNLKLEQSSVRMTATIRGHAYYVPAKTVKLNDKVVPVK